MSISVDCCDYLWDIKHVLLYPQSQPQSQSQSVLEFLLCETKLKIKFCC